MSFSNRSTPFALTPLEGKIKPFNYAVFDIETTPELDKVFLCGFYDGVNYHYWESEPLPPEHPASPISQFMDWLTTQRQYSGWRIYGHNAGNFDSLYLVSWALRHSHDFWFTVTPVQATILELEIRAKCETKRKPLRWKFVDSFRLMSASLDKLSKAFGLGGKIRRVLFDDGQYRDSASDEDTQQFYKTLAKNVHRFDYLKKDCIDLYECLRGFISLVETNGGEVGLTAASTSMKTFRRNHLTRKVPTSRHFTTCSDPDSCKGCLHDFVRRGYCGGRVEVYRERFDGPGLLNVGDFNSMYPSVMLEPMPCGGVALELQSTSMGDIRAAQKRWGGFVDATVFVPPSCYLPPLPYKDVSGKLLFPVGRFSGVFTSAEIALLESVGGRVLEGRRSAWYRMAPLFDDFVEHWYKLRDKSRPDYTEALASVAKILLNTLYGKFGMAQQRERLWFFPELKDFEGHELVPLGNVEHGIYSEKVEVEASYIIPQIAAWVTSLARVKYWQKGMEFLNSGFGLWYGDTDSLFTDAPLTQTSKLGELKLEKSATRGRFDAAKLYYLEVAGEVAVKAKGFGGFGSGRMTEAEYLEMVERHGKVELKKITKLREGLRSDAAFPSMKKVLKGTQGLLAMRANAKRVHLGNGDTKPIELDLP